MQEILVFEKELILRLNTLRSHAMSWLLQKHKEDNWKKHGRREKARKSFELEMDNISVDMKGTFDEVKIADL